MRSCATLTLCLGLLAAAAAAAAEPGPGSGKPPPPPERTWKDPKSGLIWQLRDSLPRAERFHTSNYCQRLKHAGADDWRLPTIDELRSLVRGCKRTTEKGPCQVRQRCRAQARCYTAQCRGCGPLPEDRSLRCYWPAALGKQCDKVVWSSSREPSGKVLANWFLDFKSARLISGLWNNRVATVFCVRGKRAR